MLNPDKLSYKPVCREFPFLNQLSVRWNSNETNKDTVEYTKPKTPIYKYKVILHTSHKPNQLLAAGYHCSDSDSMFLLNSSSFFNLNLSLSLTSWSNNNYQKDYSLGCKFRLMIHMHSLLSTKSFNTNLH